MSRYEPGTSLAIISVEGLDAPAPFQNQRSASELKSRRFSIASLQVRQEDRAVLLGPCSPHDLATVQGLSLARRLLRHAIGQQLVHGERLRVERVRVQGMH